MSDNKNHEIRELSRQNIETRNEIDLAEKRVALEEQRRALQQIEAENRTAHEEHLLSLMEKVIERRLALEKKLASNPSMAKLIKRQLQALGCEENQIIAMVEVAEEQSRDQRGRFAKQLNGTHN